MAPWHDAKAYHASMTIAQIASLADRMKLRHTHLLVQYQSAILNTPFQLSAQIDTMQLVPDSTILIWGFAVLRVCSW